MERQKKTEEDGETEDGETEDGEREEDGGGRRDKETEDNETEDGGGMDKDRGELKSSVCRRIRSEKQVFLFCF